MRLTAAEPACQCSETVSSVPPNCDKKCGECQRSPRWPGPASTMTPALLIKSARNFKNAVAININRARGREFIPKGVPTLSIETSSLCNLECRFCAYVKKSSAKVTMKDEFFRSCVGQAIDMGYRRFDLTPCTGDIFMDRGIFRKLEHLESAAAVEGYAFHTNFTIPRARDIKRLFDLRKLSGSRSASTDMTRRHSST